MLLQLASSGLRPNKPVIYAFELQDVAMINLIQSPNRHHVGYPIIVAICRPYLTIKGTGTYQTYKNISLHSTHAANKITAYTEGLLQMLQ